MIDPVITAKIAAAALSNEKTRKAVGWIVVAVLSPIILLVAFFCALAAGTSSHNISAVELCFYNGAIPAEMPAEYQMFIEEMRNSFTLLDGAIASINEQTEGNVSLDEIRVKAIFYALYFGAASPSQEARQSFVDCFVTYEERTRTVETEDEEGRLVETEETYTVAIPLSLESAYAKLSSLLGQEITEDDKSNISQICTLAAGAAGSGSYDGSYLRGDGYSTALNVSDFSDPTTKNAADLAIYATHAWESGWGYVWGTYGEVLTESALEYKMKQYPSDVGSYEDFIRANWLGGRTTDCVGLIKGYGWLNPDTMSIRYGTNGMPDITANQMYRAASVSGPISTMPDIPGLAVWMNGHIGVYIGNGEVVEASSTKKGVIKTQLAGRGWTHWLEIEYINYD